MRRCGLTLFFILCAACSRRSAPLPTNEASTITSAVASAPVCRPNGKDLQSVRLDIDEGFISGHDTSEILHPVWWSGNIYGSAADYERCLRPFSREQRLMYALL